MPEEKSLASSCNGKLKLTNIDVIAGNSYGEC